MHRKKRLSQTGSSTRPVVGLLFLLLLAIPGFTQEDWIRTGTGLAVEKIRLAVPDFKASTNDAKNPDLLKAFNDTLWNDLENAGIFDLVSKSFYPLQQPGQPADVKFDTWNAPPPNASMLDRKSTRLNSSHRCIS